MCSAASMVRIALHNISMPTLSHLAFYGLCACAIQGATHASPLSKENLVSCAVTTGNRECCGSFVLGDKLMNRHYLDGTDLGLPLR